MRLAIPPARHSWLVRGRVVVVTIGAHSVDTAWPWWRPYHPRELVTLPTGVVQLELPFDEVTNGRSSSDR